MARSPGCPPAQWTRRLSAAAVGSSWPPEDWDISFNLSPKTGDAMRKMEEWIWKSRSDEQSMMSASGLSKE
ncbi:hypothetical protein A0H81_13561 [Grifola frondosa]|uniref:Uncharacterized protein n=1 Tax=Grifola frondosa TaxID=5627 RepID=A0A1C7LNI0_GRIFR|nr:hypothetical protein A0H81_13561 [Grifola frondosa]